MQDIRVCTKCGEAMAVDHFPSVTVKRGGAAKTWIRNECRTCMNARRLVHRNANLDIYRQRARESARRAYAVDPGRFRRASSAGAKRRRPKINAWKRARRSTPAGLVETRIRNCFAGAIRRYGSGRKTGPAIEYGIDINALVEAVGPCPGPRDEWHIDHVIPCCAFDHTKPDEIRACWHPSNLRWMPAKDNMRKGGSYSEPDRIALILATNHADNVRTS